MKNCFTYIITCLLCIVFMKSKSQDLHFSQYFNAPLLVNPANTGFNPLYDFRIGGNYRNQWASVGGNPYKTMSLWGDAKLFNDRFETGWVGVGGALFNDAAGSGSLTSTQAQANIAYHQLLSDNSLLSAGVGLSYVQKSIDRSKLSFDNQWNGTFFDMNISPNEPFVYNSTHYFDFQAGMNYAWFPSDNLYVNAGVSIMHINHPHEGFFAPSFNDQIARRITGFLNASIKIQDLWILNPNFYFSKMATATEAVIGFNANRNLSGDGNQQLVLGLYYRSNDAIIPVIGFELSDLKITFSYDATISSLGSYNGTQGAYELSIIKSGLYFGKNKPMPNLKCPIPKF